MGATEEVQDVYEGRDGGSIELEGVRSEVAVEESVGAGNHRAACAELIPRAGRRKLTSIRTKLIPDARG